MEVEVPAVVWDAAGVDRGALESVECVRFDDGTGAASGNVELIIATLCHGERFRLVRKTFAQLDEGRHKDGAQRSDHWAHWRRELTAYESGILPAADDGLRAPALLGITDDVVYIEYVGDRQPDGAAAAMALGVWHHGDRTVDTVDRYPWLARNQLRQRLAVTDLDWSEVDLDPALEDIWRHRENDLEILDALPWCIAHGDFSIGNLRAFEGDVVAIDWATLGISPVGFDIAHLALSVLDDSLVAIYLDALEDRYDQAAVRVGYRTAVSLIGVSRAHWMTSRSLPLPPGYSDFICAHALNTPG